MLPSAQEQQKQPLERLLIGDRSTILLLLYCYSNTYYYSSIVVILNYCSLLAEGSTPEAAIRPTTRGHSLTSGDWLILWLVGNGRMVVIVLIIVPHSFIPY